MFKKAVKRLGTFFSMTLLILSLLLTNVLVLRAEPETGSIVVDGIISDWNKLPTSATGNGTVKQLYSKQDNENGMFYLLIIGTSIGQYNDFYLDIDNDKETGWRNRTWSNCGADYLIENENLFKQSNGTWEFKGKVDMVKTSTNLEIGLELSRFEGYKSDTPIGVGYSVDNREFLPLNGNPIANTSDSPTPTGSIHVDGNISDWIALPTVAKGNGAITELYSKQDTDDGMLYLLIRGTDLGQYHDFYLDVDNNKETGWRNRTWVNCGADYLIENNNLFKRYNDTWEFKGTVDMVKSPASMEFGVPLSNLEGYQSSIEIGIGYSMDNREFLPLSGNLLANTSSTPTTPPPLGSIRVDGITTDWNDLPNAATGNGAIKQLYTKQDQANGMAYLLIMGTSIGRSNDFYLDIDQNKDTGWRNRTWSNCGADYLIENENLYKWTNGSWEFKGTVDMAKTLTSMEIGVPLSQLGKEKIGVGYGGGEDLEIGVGYSMDNREFLPLSGNPLANTSTSPVTPPTPGSILVDGNTNDWNQLPLNATGKGSVEELYSLSEEGLLYLMVHGTSIGKYNDFYLDIDNNKDTGWRNMTWSNCGADYLIENENLYKWSKDSWEFKGTVTMAKSTKSMEIAVELSKLEGYGPVLLIGYSMDNREFLPLNGSPLGTTIIQPESTYKIVYGNLTKTIIADDPVGTTLPVTLAVDKMSTMGYSKVRVNISVTGPGTAQILATDTNGATFDVAQIGYWGPQAGFPISKDYQVSTNFTGKFSKEGTYTIKADLVDLLTATTLCTSTKTVEVSRIDPLKCNVTSVNNHNGTATFTMVIKNNLDQPVTGLTMADFQTLSSNTLYEWKDYSSNFEDFHYSDGKYIVQYKRVGTFTIGIVVKGVTIKAGLNVAVSNS